MRPTYRRKMIRHRARAYTNAAMPFPGIAKIDEAAVWILLFSLQKPLSIDSLWSMPFGSINQQSPFPIATKPAINAGSTNLKHRGGLLVRLAKATAIRLDYTLPQPNQRLPHDPFDHGSRILSISERSSAERRCFPGVGTCAFASQLIGACSRFRR
jgi:hypothetical protein